MKTVLADLKLVLVLAFVSVFLILFDKLDLLNFPKMILQTVTIPIEYGLYQSGSTLTRQVSYLLSARRAAKENPALKKQLAELLTENATLRKKIVDAEAMLDQQSRLSPKTYSLFPARVIGLGRFLMIDQGAKDGAVKGQSVVYKDNFIGLIKEVSPRIALVQLPGDPDSRLAVFSQNLAGKARGVLTGQFGSKLLMDKILHQENISAGDLVYSEGTEGIIPRGLILGKVSTVLDKPNEVFKQAEVEPLFDNADLEVVFVMRD